MSTQTERLSAALEARYRIERELGHGGMATVYLAHDVRHSRKVALKVLKPELGAVLGVERFLAEIQVTANLQHPNLLPLFDSGEANGLLFYVMPFVDGESLRARLGREKQLPVDEAVRIASAVASALTYAHERGVIHRDLKPENILLQAGQPVIADFGIALAVSNAGGTRVTQTGLSLGTPHYMSPEQAAGDRLIDARSDIYSLGAMTYEMLVGDPPHLGGTAQAIIAKVLTERPPSVQLARPSVGEPVAYAVERALEKLPADRWTSAGEFAEALRGKLSTGATRVRTRTAPGASLAATSRRMRVALGVLAVTSIAGIVGTTWLATRKPAPLPLSRFTVELPDSMEIGPTGPGTGASLALSSDGSQLAFVGRHGARNTQVYLRRRDDLPAQPIRGTEGVQQIAISPDGKSLVFKPPRGLRVVPSIGGTPRVIVDSGSVPHWGQNNLIAYSAGGSVWVVNPDGGQRRLLIGPDRVRRRYDQPHILPSGSHALVTWWKRGEQGADSARVGLVSIDDGVFTDLGMLGSHARYAAPGYVLFGRVGGDLYAAPFSLSTRTFSGPATLLLQEVWQSAGNAQTDFAVSDDGSIVYHRGSGQEAESNEFCLVDRHGNETCLRGLSGSFGEPRVSPDGKRVAFRTSRVRNTPGNDPLFNIAMYDIAAGTTTTLVAGAFPGRYEWTRSGERLLFVVPNGNDSTLVMSIPWDQSAPAQVVARGGTRDFQQVWPGPRGGWTVIRRGASRTNADLFIAPADSLDHARPFVTQARDARISPTGRLVAYATSIDVTGEVYVTTLPGPGPRVTVSVNGGTQPQWSRDGKTIFYRTASHMMAATVTEQPSLTITRRDTLFDERGRFVLDGPTRYDVMPDGRLLMERRRGIAAGDGSESIVWITNWTRLLEQSAAARR